MQETSSRKEEIRASLNSIECPDIQGTLSFGYNRINLPKKLEKAK